VCCSDRDVAESSHASAGSQARRCEAQVTARKRGIPNDVRLAVADVDGTCQIVG
jgi:hypothetical protein